MKKSLSALLAATLVFSSFASIASAADAELTAQQKFEALKEKGIFAGINGEAALDQKMNRAQFARVAALILGLEGIGNPDTKVVTEKPFSDVALNAWYTEEIAAAKEAKLLEGNGDGTFKPTADISVQELAVVAAKLLGLTPVADATVEGAAAWAAGSIKALQDAKVDFPTNYKEAATREQLVNLSFVAEAKVNVSTLALSSVAQSGVKKFEVKFNRALTAAEKADLTFEVKYGFVPYSVTAKYADDNKSATLESSFNFPAGDYTVTVKGFEAKTVKVEAEKATKVEIQATSLQKAAGQDLKVKLFNQFGEEMTGLSDGNISAYNGTQGKSLTVTDKKLDLSADANAKVDDTVIVTVTYPTAGLSASKTFKVVAASTITSMTFGPVAPLKDKTRITVGDTNIPVPYTLVDQYGENVKMAVYGPSATHGDLTFASSDNAIVNPASFEVITDNVLTFDAGAKAGTAIISVLNAKGGITTTFNIKVEDTAKVKTFVANHPGVLVAASENVKVPYMATDSFDAPIAKADFAKAATNGQVSITSSNPAVGVVYSFDSKGELTLNFSAAGTTTVYVWVGGTIASQFTVEVKAAAAPTKITGIKAVNTLFAVGAEVTLNYKDNVVAVDNYGRAIADALPAGYAFTVAKSDVANDKVTVAGSKITADKDGTAKIKLTLTNNGTPVADSSYEFEVKVIKAADVTGFEINKVNDIYQGGATAFTTLAGAGSYAADITLVGKDASGNKVNIKQSDFITALTSSNQAVVATDTVTGKVYGTGEGTATVAAWKGATKLAEVEVKAVKAAPVATTVEFANAEKSVAALATVDLGAELTVKDQYGVAIAKTGTWATSDAAKATVSASGVVTGVAAGEATISFVTTNGIVKTVLVTVN